MTVASTPEGLESFFRSVEDEYSDRHGAARRRLVPDPHIGIYAEVRFPVRQWGLVVELENPRQDHDLVLTAGITCRSRSGSVEIVAEPGTDRRLFCTLLVDLVTQVGSRSGSTDSTLVARINAWRRMLGRGFRNGLTPEARMGLYGELAVLRDLLVPAVGAAAVAAWTGPSGEAKDFRHQGTAIEAKTVSRRDPDRCRVTNEQQLDTEGFADVFLVHQVVESSPSGESLNDLVSELRSTPELVVVISELEDRLLEAGWIEAQQGQGENDRYTLTRRRCYHVGEGFPRMVPADLVPGVSGVSYTIDLATCRAHLTDEGVLQASVSRSFTPAKEH